MLRPGDLIITTRRYANAERNLLQVFPHARWFTHNELEQLRSAWLDGLLDDCTSLQLPPFKGADHVHSAIADRDNWRASRFTGFAPLALVRSSVVSAPITASSDETAILELITQAGGR